MLTKLDLSSEELNKLNYESYYYPCPIVQKRLHSIYIEAVSGLSNEKVCNLTGAHRNSLKEWIQIYEQNGFDALLQVGYGTNTSLLENEAGCIKELFIKQPPRSIAEAGLKIKELTGIERSHTDCGNL